MIGKDLLDTTLAIVKVALYGANCDILAFLCHHLALLHITDALFRIEDHDLCARNILEALQSSLTGIAGGCNQNDYLLVHMQLLHGSGQEIRQDLERHILESTGWAVPQFQHISALEQVCDLCNIFCFKILGGIRTLGAVNQFCLCKICQILFRLNGCNRFFPKAFRQNRIHIFPCFRLLCCNYSFQAADVAALIIKICADCSLLRSAKNTFCLHMIDRLIFHNI